MDVSYILDDLNSPQREAVSDESQFSLILAGAGSGKTKVITHKVAWLCKVHNLNPMSLLTVTFIPQLYVLLKVKIYQQELLYSGILINKKEF